MEKQTPRPQQHCDHECVCLFFDHDSKIAKHDGTPCMKNAKGCANCCQDTRSRPHTSIPAPIRSVTYVCPHAGTHENNLYACLISEFKSSCNYLIKENKCPFEQHDTDIRNSTLDDIIEDIRFREVGSKNPKGWLWRQPELVEYLESLKIRTQREHP